jgi:group II intron reverse transcriptase/maturase
MSKAKPFKISKKQVWEAYKRVKANQGAPGVDGQTIEEFDESLSKNLYKIWNRMSSGSYQAPPVRRVEIPKDGGGIRPLGIPTVSDRIAQMVVKQVLEPELEKHFHEDSYGYRPGKSAHQAIGQARKRCWDNGWVLDLDIKGFFDNISHDLMMKAVRCHTSAKWVLLYIERWLKAPVETADGTLVERTKGTPQGGVISPLLANLYLHYAFDKWMVMNYARIQFERYADDAICHCKTREQAEHLKVALEKRFKECGLELNAAKTKIVYCKGSSRKIDYPVVSFDFLGYTFRPRGAINRQGEIFTSFSPAMSDKAGKAIRQEIRSWELQKRSNTELEDLAKMYNAKIRGWINYYGAYYKSQLYLAMKQIDRKLVLWAMRKYKKLRGHRKKAAAMIKKISRQQKDVFAHWSLLSQNG